MLVREVTASLEEGALGALGQGRGVPPAAQLSHCTKGQSFCPSLTRTLLTCHLFPRGGCSVACLRRLCWRQVG